MVAVGRRYGDLAKVSRDNDDEPKWVRNAQDDEQIDGNKSTDKRRRGLDESFCRSEDEKRMLREEKLRGLGTQQRTYCVFVRASVDSFPQVSTRGGGPHSIIVPSINSLHQRVNLASSFLAWLRQTKHVRTSKNPSIRPQLPYLNLTQVTLPRYLNKHATFVCFDNHNMMTPFIPKNVR